MDLCTYCLGINVNTLVPYCDPLSDTTTVCYLYQPTYSALTESAQGCKLCGLFLHASEARNAGNNYPETYKQHEQSRIWLVSGGEMFFDLKEPKRLSQVHVYVGRGGLLYAAVLNITTRPDDPLALSGDVVGREVITNVGPRAVFDRLRTWYQDCCADHLECRSTHRNANEALQELLTRVIDVGTDAQAQLHLRESRGLRGQYAALTYCWGTSPAFHDTDRIVRVSIKWILPESIAKNSL